MTWTTVCFLLGLTLPGCAQAACSVSASGVAFGIYDATSASPDDATGTVTVNCTIISGPAGYTIGLSTGGSGSYAARTLTSGGSTLSYQLYANASRTQIWGNGSGGSTTVASSFFAALFGGVATHQIYGRIPAGLVVSPGSYGDTIIVTVTY
jgi:spore coat protein U-like protein